MNCLTVRTPHGPATTRPGGALVSEAPLPRARTVTALTGATALVAATLAATSGVAANAATSTRAIPNTKPAWTAHATKLGAVRPGAVVHARVYLAPRGGMSALEARATAMATKGNAQYHKFLTAAQYHRQYDPTAATVRAARSWLRASGLKVTGVASYNRYLTVSGHAAAAEKAFGTQIANYRSNGKTLHAPTTAIKAPAALASRVLTVTGLSSVRSLMKPNNAPPPAGFRNARPCNTYWGQLKASKQADYSTPLPQFEGSTLQYAPCGYVGPQLRNAYEGNAGLYGDGVTVAIVDAYASPTLYSDANNYATQNGDGSYAPGQYTQTVASHFHRQPQCGPSGWYGEQSLDVEAVHAMAPDADIHYYGAASCYDNDFIDTLSQVDEDNTAQLVTNSWGEPAEGVNSELIPAFEQVFLQGGVQGISFMFSSGDEGDELANTGIKQADYPTSDPYVTSVGGTSTAIGPNATIEHQTGWGTIKYSLSSDQQSWNEVGWLYGAGGGTSALFNRPSYQDGVDRSPYRQVPDVAMDADPNTGMLIGLTQTFPDGTYYDQYRIGGTSLASPLFAGMTALAIENAGSPEGLLNPAIYSNQQDFTDVRQHSGFKGDVRVDYANSVNADNGLVYSVRTFGDDSSLEVKNGYDLVTGVGVPSPAWIDALGSTT
jgi:subtilase family serine protease